MNRPQLIAGLAVLLAAFGFIFGLSAISAEGGYSGLSPRFIPSLVAGGLTICGIGLVWQAVRGGFRNFNVEEEGQALHLNGLQWLIGGILAHIFLIGQIGFVFSSTLLLACVARGFGSKQFVRDSLIGLAITLPIWALFTQVLGLGLPFFPLLMK